MALRLFKVCFCMGRGTMTGNFKSSPKCHLDRAREEEAPLKGSFPELQTLHPESASGVRIPDLR